MIKVYQTRFGLDINDLKNCGNCFESCVASIFELDINKVPSFNFIDNWVQCFSEWLYDNFGLTYVQFIIEDTKKLKGAFKGFHLITGDSPRNNGIRHCCVGQDLEIIFDPLGEDSEQIKENLEYGFFVKPIYNKGDYDIKESVW